MEGNYALRLIKRADYCAFTSLNTGLDVAHVRACRVVLAGHCGARRILTWACAAPRCRRRGRGRGDHRVPRCLSSAVYMLDVGPWPQLSAASAARVAA